MIDAFTDNAPTELAPASLKPARRLRNLHPHPRAEGEDGACSAPPPPSQRCLKDAFTSKHQALLATVHATPARRRSSAQPPTVSSLYTLANDEPTVNALPLAAVSDPRRVADQTALC